jgi:hypothetical protein
MMSTDDACRRPACSAYVPRIPPAVVCGEAGSFGGERDSSAWLHDVTCDIIVRRKARAPVGRWDDLHGET